MTPRVTERPASSPPATPQETPPATPEDAAAPPPAPAGDLEQLRAILIGSRLEDIAAVQARLDDPALLARTISPALPEAIARGSQDPRLARALAPTLEHAITASVRRNPHPLADALFPVMGPAIRSAIAHALSTMLESFNRTIEHSVSWQAMRWRLEALRTGKPFAEVVLLHTLEYRVEQVFLVHRETGLLLQHVAAPSSGAHDADMISAMLTAIRDFARDSFGAAADETLDAFKIGDVSGIVEQGPYAIVAAVASGLPPAELRVALKDAIETIHLHFSNELAAFTGDSAPFAAARPVLEACLLAKYRTRRRAGISWRWGLAGAAAAVALAVWLGFSIRDGRRWNSYLNRLRAEPGLVVVDAERRGRTFTVSGLRDPLAIDPATLVAASGLPAGRVVARWQPYQTLEPSFVLARATRLLRPPANVTLAMHDGVLSAVGAAAADWVMDSERLAPTIAGVRRFDREPTRTLESSVAREHETASLTFLRGTTDFTPGEEQRRARVFALLQRADALARASGQRVQLRVVGHTDADGTEALNRPLSAARADVIVAALAPLELQATDATAEGIGAARPLTPGRSDSDKRLNRRVSFLVSFTGREAAGRRP
jgi:OOP family OmpA-OmpF porin